MKKIKIVLMALLIMGSIIVIISLNRLLKREIDITKKVEESTEIAVYLDDTKTTAFPAKDAGYMFGHIECTNGGVAEWDAINWKLAINEITTSTNCNVYFVNESKLLRNKIIADTTVKNQLKGNAPNSLFQEASTDSDTGLWTYPEASETSYFFRGSKSLLDNNVVFAEHQWKVIRIDKDGNVKLIYNGKCPNNSCVINSTGTETQVRTVKFADSNEHINYMGYTFNVGAGEKDSGIKKENESWYADNLAEYDSYIADVIYCNDRSGMRVSGRYTYYAGFDRIRPAGGYGSVTPKLECTNVGDRYTVSDAIGNGRLNQKVGLITIDEIVLAGSRYSTSNNNYLNSNQQFWNMTPSMANQHDEYSYSVPYVSFYLASGSISEDVVTGLYGLRSVITLNANVIVKSGNGSELAPYVVSTN